MSPPHRLFATASPIAGPQAEKPSEKAGGKQRHVPPLGIEQLWLRNFATAKSAQSNFFSLRTHCPCLGDEASCPLGLDMNSCMLWAPGCQVGQGALRFSQRALTLLL